MAINIKYHIDGRKTPNGRGEILTRTSMDRKWSPSSWKSRPVAQVSLRARARFMLTGQEIRASRILISTIWNGMLLVHLPACALHSACQGAVQTRYSSPNSHALRGRSTLNLHGSPPHLLNRSLPDRATSPSVGPGPEKRGVPAARWRLR